MMAEMNQAEPLLQIRNLSIGFADQRGIVLAADDVNLTLMRNETLGLLGESGCGKSITLRSIMGLIPYPGEVLNGEIIWQDRDLLKLRRKELEAVRGREIAMIFQDPSSSLNPVYTVETQLAETLRLKNRLPAAEIRETSLELLRQVGIPSPEERLKAYPHQLSGGMRQRLMIALAIASGPSLILADEPTTALDVTIQNQILDLLRELKDTQGISMILVSHDIGVVSQNSDRIAIMYAGKVMELADTETLINTPAHPYTAGLLAAVPSLTVSGTREPLRSIPGQIPNLADLPPGCPFQERCQHARPECAQVDMSLRELQPGHWSACPFVEAG